MMYVSVSLSLIRTIKLGDFAYELETEDDRATFAYPIPGGNGRQQDIYAALALRRVNKIALVFALTSATTTRVASRIFNTFVSLYFH